MTILKYVKHPKVAEYKRRGWKVVSDLSGTSHGMWSVIMEYPTMIVGIAGQKGTGKGEVARILTEHYGAVVHKMMAPMKAQCLALGLTHEHIEGGLKETPCDQLMGLTPRQYMILLGNLGRSINPRFWSRQWARSLPTCPVVVADDVRFFEEAEAIKVRGGVVVHLRRPEVEHDGVERTEVIDFACDITLWNDDSLAVLEHRVINSVGLRLDPSVGETFGPLEKV